MMDWTTRQAIPVWWSFLWRAALYGAVTGLFIRTIAYFVSFFGDFDPLHSLHLASIIGAACYFPVTLMAMRQALSKNVPPSDA